MTPEEAATELLRREDAAEDLLSFTEYTHEDFQAGAHHATICDELEALERGENDRLMVFAPPRHTKSELVSRRMPAWYLGRHPRRQVIGATYNQDLSTDFGLDVRTIMESRRYDNVFPGVGLSRSARASRRWRTTAGGIYIATGVGGTITGRGSHLGIVDDPIKNAAEAQSALKRDAIWKWYKTTFYTRRMPCAAIVVIMTRWHEDDLAGRLLEAQERGGDKWRVICLPAIIDEGLPTERALWPEWFPLAEMQRTRANLLASDGLQEWLSLYQQRPTQDEGTYFQRDWIQYYDELPAGLHLYGLSDYAVTEGAGDYTEHGMLGVDPREDIYVVDWWSGRTSSDVWIEKKLDMVKRHKPLAWFGEAGVIQKAMEPALKKMMHERRAFVRIEWLSSIADKPTRSRAIQARAAQRKMYFPRTPWAARIIEQMLKFPNGKHDDAVDVLGLFGRALDMTHPAIVKRETPEERRDAWGDPYARQRSKSWKVA